MLGSVFKLGAVIERWLKGSAAQPRPLTRAQRKPQQFHSVTIRAQSGACAAARALGATRFLASEAPPLPLAGCTRKTCKCSFVHYDDRREDARRTVDLGLPHPIYSGAEGRLGRGRRRVDRPDEDDDELFGRTGKRRPAGDGDP